LSKKVIIIGAGFAGLSAAAFMAKAGWDVTVIEKNKTAGGRAKQLIAEGFTFDMGPSWYWMPDVFERFFEQFGKKVTDYYSLARLDPSYRVYWQNGFTDIPADYDELKSKNLWRIVSDAKIEEWNRTKNMDLPKIFNGLSFTRLTEES